MLTDSLFGTTSMPVNVLQISASSQFLNTDARFSISFVLYSNKQKKKAKPKTEKSMIIAIKEFSENRFVTLIS